MERREDDDLDDLFKAAALGPVILDGHTLCGPGCSAPNPTTGACANAPCRPGCNCHLYSRDEDDSPQNPGSWKHEKGPGLPHVPIIGRVYRCFCVK